MKQYFFAKNQLFSKYCPVYRTMNLIRYRQRKDCIKSRGDGNMQENILLQSVLELIDQCENIEEVRELVGRLLEEVA